MLLHIILALALLVVLAYGTYEIRRWGHPEIRELLSPKQRLLRAWGLFFLLMSLGLWLGGTYLHQPAPLTHTSSYAEKLYALKYVAYWTLTALMVVPLLPLALLDTRESARRALADRAPLSEERKALLSLMQQATAPDQSETDNKDG